MASPYGEWCNGSTADSGSACLGSNPSSPAYTRPAVTKNYGGPSSLPSGFSSRFPPFFHHFKRLLFSAGHTTTIFSLGNANGPGSCRGQDGGNGGAKQ